MAAYKGKNTSKIETSKHGAYSNSRQNSTGRNEYTAYLIGWKDKINTKYVDLFKIEPKKKLLNDSYK